MFSKSVSFHRLRLATALSVWALLAAGAISAAHAQAPEPFPASATKGRIDREIGLPEIGLAEGARLSGLGGSRDFFFPVPRGARLAGVTLNLAYETASSTDSRRGVEVLLGERTAFLQTIATARETGVLHIPLDGVDTSTGFAKVTIRYGGLIEQKCLDLRYAADHLTVLPETALKFSVDREMVNTVAATLALMPQQVDIYVPARAMTTDEYAAAIVAARGLRATGHEIRFQLLPSASLTSSIGSSSRASGAVGQTYPSLMSGQSMVAGIPARFAAPPTLATPFPAPVPEATNLWSRGAVVIASPNEVAALGVARNPDAESADPSRDVDAPKSALSLIRFGGAPAILISGDDPRAAADLIASPWRSAAIKSDVSARLSNGGDIGAGALTFDRLRTDLGARSVIDRALWSVSIGGRDLPSSRRVSGVRVDVAVAPDDVRSNAVVSAFFNDRLMDSVTTDNNVMARLKFDVPDGMAGLNNNLRVVVQRQTRGGDCLTMPVGSPAQLLDSSAVLTAPAADLAHDFFELAPKFRDGVEVFVDRDSALDQTSRLATLSAVARELSPAGAPVRVRYVEPGDSPRPSGSFIAMTANPPEQANTPIRFDRGRAVVRGPEGQTIADLGRLGDTMVAPVARTNLESGLWIRPVAAGAEPVVPASLRLDRGNVAIIDGAGVAFAFSNERDRLVEVVYPEQSTMAEIANAYRPWIVGALWLASSLLIVVGLLRFHRPGRPAGKA